jgi:2'-5' RNA ligase
LAQAGRIDAGCLAVPLAAAHCAGAGLHWPGMRLFVGIPLADQVVGELAALVVRLRPTAGNLRWSKAESWHITLQFLGNANEEQLQCLTARLAEVRCAPVRVELCELGAFERTGVFFADVAVTPGLAALQEQVVAATSRCGFVADARPFHPHITLARKAGSERAGEPGSKNARADGVRDLLASNDTRKFSRFTAKEFLLYESHLGSEGSRYEVRARFPLG